MPLKNKWGEPGTRVITPDGYGTIVSYNSIYKRVVVELKEKGTNQFPSFYSPGELALKTDFTVVRILNITKVGFISSACNYPIWEEAQEALESPHTQDETLFALNFETRQFLCNRGWEFISPYRLLEAYYDMHHRFDPLLFETREQALGVWQGVVESLAGTSGHILLYVLVDLEEAKILAQALFSTLEVLKREHFV